MSGRRDALAVGDENVNVPELDADLALLIEEAAEEGRRMFERRCPTCWTRFVPRRSHGVYCKTSCRVLAWERRQLEA